MNTEKEQLQYLFDNSAGPIIKQGVKSFSSERGSCVYRGMYEGSPVCCAVGHLISDEEYSITFEEWGILDDHHIAEAVERSVKFKLNNNHLNLLASLQDAHDSSAEYDNSFLETFKEMAKEIAVYYELEWRF